MTTIPPVQPAATMEEAFAERARLVAKHIYLWEEGTEVIRLTAKALYGESAVIDWANHTARAKETP